MPALSASNQLQPVLRAIDPSLAKYDTSQARENGDSIQLNPNPAGTINGAPLQKRYQLAPPEGAQSAPNGFLTGAPAMPAGDSAMPTNGGTGEFPSESMLPSFSNSGQEVNRVPAASAPANEVPLAPSIADFRKMAILEQTIFGESFQDHDFATRLDHLEKEALGAISTGSVPARIARLEAKIGAQAAFAGGTGGNSPSSPSNVNASFAGDDAKRIIAAIPYNEGSGDYLNSLLAVAPESYPHWAHFPVRVRLPADSPSVWRKVMNVGIEKWGHVVPLVAVTAGEADIEVIWVNHLVPRLLGVTRLVVEGGRMHMQIFMLRPTFYLHEVPETSLGPAFFHELGHAIGISGHSSHPDDVMYPVELDIQGKLSLPASMSFSPRDLNTVRRLYESQPVPPTLTLPRPLEWGRELAPDNFVKVKKGVNRENRDDR